MKYTENLIEPTLPSKKEKSIVIESNIPAASLSDILIKYDISQKLMIEIIKLNLIEQMQNIKEKFLIRKMLIQV